MDLTVSRPIKILALVAVVAAVAGIAMLMLKPKPSASAPVVITKAPAPATPAAPRHRATTAAKAKAAPTHRAPVHKVVHAARLPVVGKNGLPTAIDQALESHRIVVVSVFDSQSATDAISYAEAKSGAADARVGFVGINLLDNPLAAALTSALPGGGLLPDPGVLVYSRPSSLALRFDGFADREAIAQAAIAARTSPAPAAATP